MLTGPDTALATPPPHQSDPYADILGWLLTAPPAPEPSRTAPATPTPATPTPATPTTATGTESPC